MTAEEAEVEDHAAFTNEAPQRATCLLITCFEGTYERSTEPELESLSSAGASDEGKPIRRWAWQPEICPQTQARHIHIALDLSGKLSVQKVVSLVFPKTGPDKKAIDVPKKGVKFDVLAMYCTKTHSRDGPDFFTFNWNRPKRNPKRVLEDVHTMIQQKRSWADVCLDGDSRNLVHRSAAVAAEVFAARPISAPHYPLERLVGWERALMELLVRRPKEGGNPQWFFVPNLSDAVSPFDRLPRAVKSVLSRKKKSQQIVLWHSTTDPELLQHCLSEVTKVIFIISHAECPVTPSRVYALKNLSTCTKFRSGRPGFELVDNPHVVVLAYDRPPKDSRFSKHMDVWAVNSKLHWESRSELLERGEKRTAFPFIEFDTLGAAGILRREAEICDDNLIETFRT